MENIEKKFEFEVAFSFLEQDEKLACEISYLIKDRLTTFIYSEHQKEIAGTDGEKTFNEVFGEKARIVVVLYRNEWGKTKWTRIEETAIRNRGYEEGYDFTLFVLLDPTSAMPKWLPNTRIYFGFDKYGVEGLAPVIEAKVQESGGQVRSETLDDKLDKIKRTRQLHDERVRYLSSKDAYNDAINEIDILYLVIEKKINEIEKSEIVSFNNLKKDRHREFEVNYLNYKLIFLWEICYRNILKDSKLTVEINYFNLKNPDLFFESQYNKPKNKIIFKKKEYIYDKDYSQTKKGWRNKKGENEFNTSQQLMEEWLKLFLEKINKLIKEQQKIF